MILALVFMAFCVFVGGSVLASASANGARVKRSYEEEQQYLSLRSASLLLTEELYSSESITFEHFSDGSGANTIAIDFPSDTPALRELALLCAAKQYASNFENCRIEGYASAPVTMVQIGDKQCAQTDFSLSVTSSNVDETVYARLRCDPNFTLSVVFYSDSAYQNEYDLLSLVIKMQSEEETGGEENYDDDGPADGVILSWGLPMIEKGGV